MGRALRLQDIQMLGKALRADRQTPRITAWIADPVIHQDDGLGFAGYWDETIS